MRKIPLRNRKGEVRDYALVSDEDYEWVRQFRWSLCNGYAARKSSKRLGDPRYILMHRVIIGAQCMLSGENHAPKFEVDHIDRNGLNNQRENLRLCTHSQNRMNAAKTMGTDPELAKGLCWIVHKSYASGGCWKGQLMRNGKLYQKYSLHREVVEEWLLKTREELHGEFARHE